jgi:hypothetical protein
MTPETLTLSIVSVASSFVLGYIVGIVSHFVEMVKSEKKFTLPLV